MDQTGEKTYINILASEFETYYLVWLVCYVWFGYFLDYFSRIRNQNLLMKLLIRTQTEVKNQESLRLKDLKV